MIVMLGCDVGTYRFRCVRRLFNVPPFPPSYWCRLNDGGYSVIFVLCGRIRRRVDISDAPGRYVPTSRIAENAPARGLGGGDSDASVLFGYIRRWVDTTDVPAGTSPHHASRKTHRRGDWGGCDFDASVLR